MNIKTFRCDRKQFLVRALHLHGRTCFQEYYFFWNTDSVEEREKSLKKKEYFLH